ncbi:MAG: putative Ig domain-containing protein [Ignavibacteriae bacterium]|nr:putative Ig domain-containing protein [Ignavibacteriota bacterium]
MTSSPVRAIEGELFSFDIAWNDVDTTIGQVVRLRATSGPAWLLCDSISGRLTGRPEGTDVGSTVLTLVALDDSGAADTVGLPLIVHHVNHRPSFQHPTIPVAVEDVPFAFRVWAHDRDSLNFSDHVRYSMAPTSHWLHVDSLTGDLTGIPGISDLNDSIFVVTAIDDSGASDTLALEIPIRHMNHAPSFAGILPITGAEDSLMRHHLFATDRDSILGDRIHFRMIFGPGWLTLDTLTGIASGVPGGGDVGDGSLTVIALDDSGASATLVLPYAVRHTNHAPHVSAPGTRLAVEDSLYVSQIVATDADAARFGDTLRFTAILKPAWLTLDPQNGTLTGIPRAGQLSDSTLAVVVADSRGGSSSLTTTISVAHTNHAPVFASIPEKNSGAVEDVPFTMNCAASDGDTKFFGDSLTYSFGVHPQWLSINGSTGIVTGTPAESDHDTTFTVLVTDGLATTTLTVPLSVLEVNDPPTIVGKLNVVLAEDSSAALDLAPFVHDPDNRRDALQWGITSAVEGADYHFCSEPPDGAPVVHADDDSLVIYLDTASARVYVQARKNFTGSLLPIVITVCDPDGLTATDTLMVTVVPVNDPPVLSRFEEITAAEDDSVLVPNALLASLVTDPDDADSLLLWHCSGSTMVTPTRTQDGMLVRFASNWHGTDSITITAMDRAGASDSVRVALRVLPVNDPPVLARVPDLAVHRDSIITFCLSGYVSDVDDSTAGFRAGIGPIGPAISGDPDVRSAS